MAIERQYMQMGQSSIYGEKTDHASKREFEVRLTEPDGGISEETGLLVLIPGYGGGIESNVFKKMRNLFSDKYNLLVMQCSYFGSEFMDARMTDFLNSKSDWAANSEPREKNVGVQIVMNETPENFNDMSYMQAMDLITATLLSIRLVQESDCHFNQKKIILYGVSHGGYLAYLMNRLCPGLYSFIIDISGYVTPYFLNNLRPLKNEANWFFIDYMIRRTKEVQFESELYDLKYLYQSFSNTCRVISFGGRDDEMVDIREKEDFIHSIGVTADIIVVSADEVDGELFMNAEHGLGADFLKVFCMVYETIADTFPISDKLELEEKVVIYGKQTTINLKYDSWPPCLER